MKHEHWRIFDPETPGCTPRPNQDIYFTFAEGEGKPFQDPGRMKAEPDVFRELLAQNPQCLIIWQPAPPPPTPPADYRVLHTNRCAAPDFYKRRCEYCEFSRCLRFESDGPCEHQRPQRELSLSVGGDKSLWL